MALEYMEVELYSINITSISFNFKVIGYTLFWICSILFQVSQEHCKVKIHNLINNK